MDRIANRANMKAISGDLPGAIEDCRRALDLDPTYWEAARDLGRWSSRMGNQDAAASAFAKALEHCPDSQRENVLIEIRKWFRERPPK